MKKGKLKKILATGAMGIMALAMPFALTGCAMIHEQSTIYEHNDDYHWYKCIDDNCNALFALEEHDFIQDGTPTVMDTKTITDYKCDCGAEKQEETQTQEQMWNVFYSLMSEDDRGFLITRGKNSIYRAINAQTKEFVKSSYYGAGFQKLIRDDSENYQLIVGKDDNYDGTIDSYEYENGTYEELYTKYQFSNGNLIELMDFEYVVVPYQDLMDLFNNTPNAQFSITKNDGVYTCLISSEVTSIEFVYTDNEIKKIEMIEYNNIDIYNVVYDIDRINAGIDSFVVPSQN